MKKFLIEYVSIIGYAVTGLIFGLAFFLILFNFYHAKEVSETYIKNDNFVDVYTRNKGLLEQVKNNIAGFDANNFRGHPAQTDLLSMKSRIDMCISSFENSKANDIFTKKEVSVLDVYNLLTYYQSDIVNDCVTMQLYSLKNYTGNLASFEAVRPFIENNAMVLTNDLDYVKRSLQNNSSFGFSSEYDKINIFNLTRDSYTRIENSYQNSVNLLVNVSEWFKKAVGGAV